MSKADADILRRIRFPHKSAKSSQTAAEVLSSMGLPEELAPPALQGGVTTMRGIARLAVATAEAQGMPLSPEIVNAQRDILAFTQLFYPPYVVDEFHRDLAGLLQRVVAPPDPMTGIAPEPITNLIVEAPPQHGKSMLVSHHLPAFWLMHHPDLPVLLTSYAADRAQDNSRRAREVVIHPYWQKVGGHIPNTVDHWRMSDWGFKNCAGYVFAAGIGGPIAGHGFGLGIIDDPFENWERAQSDATRKTVWEWWQGSFLTRMWEGSRIVIIMTRWNEDDLVGQILAEEGTVEQGGKWWVARYPALIESEEQEKTDRLHRKFHEALAPRRFSAKHLEGVRGRVGPMVWNAEYQQSPTRPEGDFFKIGRVRIETVPPATICNVVQTKEVNVEGREIIKSTPVNLKYGVRFWDLAGTAESRQKRDPDYTVGTLLAEDEKGWWWVLDVVRARLDPEQVQQLVLQTAKLDGKAVKVWIEQEPGQSGKDQIGNYQKMLAGFRCEGRPHGGDKAIWADGFAGQVNAGNVVLLAADWNKDWLSEFAAFPNGTHDDQVDSGSGGFNVASEGERMFKTIPFRHV